MPWTTTIALAVALGCDAFAVGLGVGSTWHGPRQLFRLSFHFGLFQFLMPLIGWWAGHEIVSFVERFGPWIAFSLLLVLGVRMIHEALTEGHGPEGSQGGRDPTRGMSLVLLSVATSVDALGVGLSLGLVGGSIWWPAVVIGVMAAVMTLTAMNLGKRLSARFGRGMGLAGGAILVGIGIRILASSP